MTDFTKKNEARKEGKARVGQEAYAVARHLRQATGGAFGNESKTHWAQAAVGTQGEFINGGKKERES